MRNSIYRICISLLTVIFATVYLLDIAGVIFGASNHWLLYVFLYFSFFCMITFVYRKSAVYSILASLLLGGYIMGQLKVIDIVYFSKSWPSLVICFSVGVLCGTYYIVKKKEYIFFGVMTLIAGIASQIGVLYQRVATGVPAIVIVIALIEFTRQLILSISKYKENKARTDYYVRPSEDDKEEKI